MACSQKQLEANRRNAQKSTGPKTADGKARSSQNSLKHGSTVSNDVIINNAVISESQEEYDQLLTNLKNELVPHTLFQMLLVKRIANCLWRSRRIVKAETAEINNRIIGISTDYYNDDDNSKLINQLTNKINARSIPYKSDTNYFLHYEMRLDHQLNRAFDMLKKLQNKSRPSTLSLLSIE